MSNGENQPLGATSQKDWLVTLLLSIFLGSLGVAGSISAPSASAS